MIRSNSTINGRNDFFNEIGQITDEEFYGLFDNSEYEGLIEIPQEIDEAEAERVMHKKMEYLGGASYFPSWMHSDKVCWSQSRTGFGPSDNNPCESVFLKEALI